MVTQFKKIVLFAVFAAQLLGIASLTLQAGPLGKGSDIAAFLPKKSGSSGSSWSSSSSSSDFDLGGWGPWMVRGTMALSYLGGLLYWYNQGSEMPEVCKQIEARLKTSKNIELRVPLCYWNRADYRHAGSLKADQQAVARLLQNDRDKGNQFAFKINGAWAIRPAKQQISDAITAEKAIIDADLRVLREHIGLYDKSTGESTDDFKTRLKRAGVSEHQVDAPDKWNSWDNVITEINSYASTNKNRKVIELWLELFISYYRLVALEDIVLQIDTAPANALPNGNAAVAANGNGVAAVVLPPQPITPAVQPQNGLVTTALPQAGNVQLQTKTAILPWFYALTTLAWLGFEGVHYYLNNN